MARILNLFFGVPQSKYAGVAILVSLAAVGLAILFSKERVPISQKLVVVGLLFLLSLPAMLVTLFQLTCMVTGAGFKNQRWDWCSGYAWLVSALIILYSILLVVMTVLSFVSEKQSKEVEKFYSRRENFEEMAKAVLTEEEKAKLQSGGASEAAMSPSDAAAAQAALTRGAPDVTSMMPPVPTMPTDMPSVNMLPMTPGGGLAQEEVPLDISMPPSTVSAVGPETFTSCGAPYQ